jgi:nitroreductase
MTAKRAKPSAKTVDRGERLLARASDAVTLEAFQALARHRHSVTKFLPHPVSPQLIGDLVEAARWAPSAFNLQPAHFTIVLDAEQRRRLADTCPHAPALREAAAIIVVTGDRNVIPHQAEAVIAAHLADGLVTTVEAAALRRHFANAFPTRGWPKWPARMRAAIAHRFGPIADLPAAEMSTWIARQASPAATYLVLAAATAGLGTNLVDAWDSARVRTALEIPRDHDIVAIVGLGHPYEASRTSSRLPVGRAIHWERW